MPIPLGCIHPDPVGAEDAMCVRMKHGLLDGMKGLSESQGQVESVHPKVERISRQGHRPGRRGQKALRPGRGYGGGGAHKCCSNIINVNQSISIEEWLEFCKKLDINVKNDFILGIKSEINRLKNFFI